MKLCQTHWDSLRAEIKSRGLGDFISANGTEAMQRVRDDLDGKKVTKENFDPLLAANNMIWSNAMQLIANIGGNPLVLMQEKPPEHPEHDCPLCYLNWLSEEHDKVCSDPNCKKPRGLRFDDWPAQAANGAAEYLKTL
jgi:hypothetical protein